MSEEQMLAGVVPESDLAALERSQMPKWMFDTFAHCDLIAGRFREQQKADEAVRRWQREREQAEFDVMEFKMRHRIRS